MECIFCAIAEGKIPSAKVYEDEHVFAFMDIAPANPRTSCGYTEATLSKYF